ncbi:uncharacterized protein LY79DRAFT_546776 [Colletotrichum navitas]|uniref:Uncharacterized protein n=1 Tax=Colletotrichum navitas TaxID=681940 RepID=A0AAD8Q5P4_9PEZI|nr:uncharacterized protein LY79DRAFT_546776 [Colletotrichum navitas]KAK1595572.1 hypothetical protein LY79DRAFT_546776 [Colletotrichum navitas]
MFQKCPQKSRGASCVTLTRHATVWPSSETGLVTAVRARLRFPETTRLVETGRRLPKRRVDGILLKCRCFCYRCFETAEWCVTVLLSGKRDKQRKRKKRWLKRWRENALARLRKGERPQTLPRRVPAIWTASSPIEARALAVMRWCPLHLSYLGSPESRLSKCVHNIVTLGECHGLFCWRPPFTSAG